MIVLSFGSLKIYATRIKWKFLIESEVLYNCNEWLKKQATIQHDLLWQLNYSKQL